MIEIEIKVRKPRYPKGFFKTSYTNRWWKWYYSLPKNGDKIKITWFPNPINNPNVQNCYIGSEGIVQDMDSTPLTDGSFVLKMETAFLVSINGSFNYIKLK